MEKNKQNRNKKWIVMVSFFSIFLHEEMWSVNYSGQEPATVIKITIYILTDNL